MPKHRKYIRRWPKLAAASAALAAYLASAFLPITSATANNLPPAPTCTNTECIWFLPETAGLTDWTAPTNSSEIWIDIQSGAMPWAEPTHLHAQLRDPNHNLLLYFVAGGANVALGSLTFFRVNADPGDPWGYDSNYVTNVSFEPAESAPGAFVRIRQVIDPNVVAPQPAASATPSASATPAVSSSPIPTPTPTPTSTPTPTATTDALPAPTSSPVPVVTPTPEVAPTVNATPSATPEVTPSATVAPEVVIPVQPTPVANSEPVATAEPVQTVESREEKQDVATVVPDRQPPAPPARPARALVPAPKAATEPAPEPETVTLAPSVQEPSIVRVGVVPPKTERAIPARATWATWTTAAVATAAVATAAATLASIGGVQLIRKRGVRNLRGSTGRRPGKLRVS